MKSTKLRKILTPILIVILAGLLITGVICLKNCSLKDSNTDLVTITFDTKEGSKVDPINIEKGTTLTNVPSSNLASSTFEGWYYDEDYNDQFVPNDKIKTDLTLHAKFSPKYDNMVVEEDNQYYEEDISSLQEITIIAEKGLTKEKFLNKVLIEGVTGELPEIDVIISGNEYTIKPGKITENKSGYEAGKVYAITIPKNYRFKNLNTNIREYTFRIAKDPNRKDQFELNPNLKNIAKTDLVNFQNLSETDQGYLILITKTVFETFNFQIGDIVSIDEKLDQNNQPIFNEDTSKVIKITSISKMDPYYVIEGVQAEIQEIFKNIDIGFTQVVKPEEQIENLNAEEMEKQILESEGLKSVTKLLAASIMESPSFKKEIKKPDFTENTKPNESSMASIEAELFEGVKAKVEFGTGYNPNFDEEYKNDFMVVRFTITYDATIKKKVKIQAKLEITQYLAITMQGYTDFSLKKSYLRFEYAFNLYSQTDLDLSVLICSVDDDDYKDISEEINNMLKKDEQDDTDNLVKQLQQFLEDESGDIELFRAPLIHVSYPVIPLIHLLDVNTNLDFVVKVNFAAGIKIDASVLEAVQIGAYGNTSTGEINSINNKLPGGDQYSLELSACGYIGVKTGFEASLTLSFCGASEFGEVGIAVFIGPYVDMYGFVKMTLSRVGRAVEYPKVVTEEIIGGYYIEIGINVEVELIARSKFFKVKIGTKLLDKNIPLVHFGNKDVLLDIEERELRTILMNDSSNQDTSQMDYKNIINAKGEYLDITTGDTNTKEMSWNQFHLTFSNNAFSYDSSKGTIIYDRRNNGGKFTDECYITYFYTGPYLKFTKTSDNQYRRCPAGTIKVIWTDTLKIPESSAGKTFNIKIELLVDGKIVEERTQTALAGTTIGNVVTNLQNVIYTNGLWNLDPKTTLIIEDTTFKYETYTRQMYASFLWYDHTTCKWILELRATKLGETPIAPEITDSNKVHFKYWSARKGVNNNYQNISSIGLSALPTGDDIYKKGYAANSLTSNHDPNEPIYRYENENMYNVINCLNNEKIENGYSIYTIAAHHYTAAYEYDDCTVTYVYPDNKTYQKAIKYGTDLSTTSLYNFLPADKTVVGYSFYEDLSHPNSPEETTSVYNDIEVYVIWGIKTYNLTINYYNDQTDEYLKYQDLEITNDLDLDKLLKDASNALVKEEGVTYQLTSWKYKSNYHYETFDHTSPITQDLELSPVYERKFNIEFNPNGGKFPKENGTENEIINVSSTSEEGPYCFYLSKFCFKDDNYYNYDLIGWKDQKTNKIYKLWTYVDDITSPTTLEAVYEKEEIIYHLTVETEHSTLLNNKTKDEYQGGYDGYIEFYNKYKDFIPEDYVNEEEHYIQTASPAKITNQLGLVYKIFYVWQTNYEQFKLEFDSAGGKDLTPFNNTYNYGTEIDLSNITPTKDSDNYGDYIFKGWKDSNDQTYLPTDKIKIKENIKLTAIWELSYKDYTVTYYLNNQEHITEKYHFEQTIIELERPIETMKYQFSGWTWYDEETQITKPTSMPAKNLIVKATTKEVYLIYVVDGEEVKKQLKDANTEISLDYIYTKTGYNVSNWHNDEIKLIDNKFTMPEKDIKFFAETTKAFYNVTYLDLDGKQYKEPESHEYQSIVTTPALPNETYTWISDDVKIVTNTFTMPASNVEIRMTSPEIENQVVYLINNEIKAYEYFSPGEKVTLKDEKSLTNNQNNFSGWYSPNTTITNNEFIMGTNNIYIYGYFTTGDIKVNINFEQNQTIILYGDKGTTIGINNDSDIKINFYNQNIKGFMLDNQFLTQITLNEEINLQAEFETKYQLTYNITYNPDIYEYDENIYIPSFYEPNTKVIIKPLPTLLETQKNDYAVINWFTSEVEIQTDEDGTIYFIMPERNVELTTSYKTITTEESFNASIYVMSPITNQLIYVTDYEIENNNYSFTYFMIPQISGYEFLYWQDDNGNQYTKDDSITKDSMNGKDQRFIGIYKKTTTKIAIFRIDGEVYSYQIFESYLTSNITIPQVTISDNLNISNWYDIYGNEINKNNKTYMLYNNPIDEDLIFDAFTYPKDLSANISFEIENSTSEYSNCVYILYQDETYSIPENTNIIVNNKHFNNEYDVTIKATIYSNGEEIIHQFTNKTQTNENIVTINIPTIEEILNELNITLTEDFNVSFTVEFKLKK